MESLLFRAVMRLPYSRLSNGKGPGVNAGPSQPASANSLIIRSVSSKGTCYAE